MDAFFDLACVLFDELRTSHSHTKNFKEPFRPSKLKLFLNIELTTVASFSL